MYMPHLVLELREGAKNTMSTWLIWRQIMYEYIYSIPLLYKLNIHAIDLKLYSGTHKGAQGLW